MFLRRLSLLLAASAGWALDDAKTPEVLLSLANEALSQDRLNDAVSYYQQGIQLVDEDETPVLTTLSLYTNLGTAVDSMGQEEQAAQHYQKALLFLEGVVDELVDEQVSRDAKQIGAQAAFFLGMVWQNLNQVRKAIDAYALAPTLDPWHWAAYGNLGAILHDDLRNHEEALVAYNKAFEILTQTEHEPTDPPEQPKMMLAELQYRIGLCIQHDTSRKCALTDDPATEVPCMEHAAHAFALAVKYNPSHESAKHMLATVTADATVKRASNDYVKSLFDDYASNFEHSLVEELGYDGFERLRRGFDRALQKLPPETTMRTDDKRLLFDVVVDAGCGTGLVGEQFRNISKTMIGVDLSGAILEEARKQRPNLYEEMIEGDITQVFTEKYPISLIIAADSYIYFGDLDPLFASMQAGLDSNGGLVAFTLENVGEDSEKALLESKPDWRWQLTASGRFAHRKEYVESVGESHQLTVVHYEPLNHFRTENGVGVRGHLFVMQRRQKEEEPEL